MTKLTEKEYWDEIYTATTAAETNGDRTDSPLKLRLKRLLGSRFFDLISAYDDYLLWEGVFLAYLSALQRDFSVVEIGSAPGDFLTRFAKRFNAIPYGVEYTSHGAEINRRLFQASGFPPDNVIETDFFSEEFLSSNKGRFDVVISRGFIEHFKDVDEVVLRHTELLKTGGLLFILIPNLRGIYYPWTKLFNPAQLPLHNIELMKLPNFKSAFDTPSLEMLRCSYFGTFSFWMFTAPAHAYWSNKLIRLLQILQRGINLLSRIIFRKNGFETSVFSPNLIYVGRKKEV